MAKPSKTNGRTLTAAERRKTAIELRKAGKTFSEIGDELAITTQSAFGLIQRELDRLNKATRQESEALRELENWRLDALQAGLWTKATDGHIPAVQQVLRIMERRAKLNGLDAPAKIAPTDPVGDEPYAPMTDTERFERIAVIFEQARKRRDREEQVREEVEANQCQ